MVRNIARRRISVRDPSHGLSCFANFIIQLSVRVAAGAELLRCVEYENKGCELIVNGGLV